MFDRSTIRYGFRSELDNQKHWDFSRLRSKMLMTTSGDVDLRPYTSPRQDQGNTGSCVAQATVKALEIKHILTYGRGSHVDLSRLAVYYLARELMFPPETSQDNGTYISNAFDAIRRFGVPTEVDWAWDTNKINTPPSWLAMRKAYLHKITEFYKIRELGSARVQSVLDCLRAGNPVVFGLEIGEEWLDYQAGQVLQVTTEVIGGHATVLLGYQDGNFIGENSWGRSWGADGFYLMNPEVIESDLSSDFWVSQT